MDQVAIPCSNRTTVNACLHENPHREDSLLFAYCPQQQEFLEFREASSVSSPLPWGFLQVRRLRLEVLSLGSKKYNKPRNEDNTQFLCLAGIGILWRSSIDFRFEGKHKECESMKRKRFQLTIVDGWSRLRAGGVCWRGRRAGLERAAVEVSSTGPEKQEMNAEHEAREKIVVSEVRGS